MTGKTLKTILDELVTYAWKRGEGCFDMSHDTKMDECLQDIQEIIIRESICEKPRELYPEKVVGSCPYCTYYVHSACTYTGDRFHSDYCQKFERKDENSALMVRTNTINEFVEEIGKQMFRPISESTPIDIPVINYAEIEDIANKLKNK